MRADNVFRRSLVLAVIASAAALAVAVGCSAPYKAKDGLPVCEDGDPDCNGDTNSGRPSRPSSPSPTSPSSPTSPEPGGETTPTSATRDAGADVQDAAPQMQPSCVTLDKCCDELKAAGYDPATCQGIVDTNNNAACYNSYTNYKNFGDCS